MDEQVGIVCWGNGKVVRFGLQSRVDDDTVGFEQPVGRLLGSVWLEEVLETEKGVACEGLG